jgi:UDP-N-acetylmuramoyl-tripeptide--D-alanyl-D-alanine ligase
VLGEMAELGKYSPEAHREIGEIAATRIDHVLCYGKETLPVVEVVQNRGKVAEFFGDVGKLKAHLFDLVREGDVVLIKGKNTNKLWQILETIH